MLTLHRFRSRPATSIASLRGTGSSLLLLALLPCGLFAQGGAPLPEITLTSTTVEVSGVTPGSEVLLQEVAHLPQGDYSVRHQELHVLHDDDRDGQVELVLEDGLPWRSIWVAIDRQGDVAVTSPDGYPLRWLELAPLESEGASMDIPRGRVHVLVSRGVEGAWGARVVDGGDLDEDGPANGTVRVDLAGVPVRPELPEPAVAALDRLKPGDVVVVVDPMTMSVAVERVRSPASAP